MKKLLYTLLALLCLPLLILAQTTYVPDDNFEAYLEANGMGNGIANDNYVTTSSIEYVQTLDLEVMFPQPSWNIADLTGIEDFTNLQYLYLTGNNNITNLNLSNNTYLIEFWCSNTQLSSLDVSSNPNLVKLAIGGNELSSLNLSGATSLTELYCSDNNLCIVKY